MIGPSYRSTQPSLRCVWATPLQVKWHTLGGMELTRLPLHDFGIPKLVWLAARQIPQEYPPRGVPHTCLKIPNTCSHRDIERVYAQEDREGSRTPSTSKDTLVLRFPIHPNVFCVQLRLGLSSKPWSCDTTWMDNYKKDLEEQTSRVALVSKAREHDGKLCLGSAFLPQLAT